MPLFPIVKYFAMTVFQQSYENRLQEWYRLRKQIIPLSTKEKAEFADAWWQKAPQVNHYLHPDDITNWPNPWDLLVDNTYCEIARGLGICYTLLMTGVSDIQFVEASDTHGNELFVVIVDNTWVINYWPNSINETTVQDFTIKRKLDISPIYRHLK